jgi:hypothetical protein
LQRVKEGTIVKPTEKEIELTDQNREST